MDLLHVRIRIRLRRVPPVTGKKRSSAQDLLDQNTTSIADRGKRVLLSHLFDFVFSDFLDFQVQRFKHGPEDTFTTIRCIIYTCYCLYVRQVTS
jgi:hypothetical protein